MCDRIEHARLITFSLFNPQGTFDLSMKKKKKKKKAPVDLEAPAAAEGAAEPAGGEDVAGG